MVQPLILSPSAASRVAQIAAQGLPFRGLLIHHGREKLEIASAGFLGVIHRDIAIFQQFAYFIAVIREN